MTQAERTGLARGAFSPGRRRNWLLPLLAVVCGTVMLADGVTMPLVAQYSGLGPGFMVVAVGSALLVTGAVLVVQILRGTEFDPEEGEGVDLSRPVSPRGFALALAGVALPVVTLPWLGFPMGATLAYVLVARANGSTALVRDLAMGLALASVTWLLFSKLGIQLGAFFPIGRS